MNLDWACHGTALLADLACSGNRTYTATVTGRVWHSVRSAVRLHAPTQQDAQLWTCLPLVVSSSGRRACNVCFRRSMC